MNEDLLTALIKEIVWSNFIGDYARARRLLSMIDQVPPTRTA